LEDVRVSQTVIAHVTDAHLGQKLLRGGKLDARQMLYGDEPSAHKENLQRVLDDIAARGITNIIFGGDIGAKDSNKYFFDLIAAHKFRLQMVLGNHDSFAEVTRHCGFDHSRSEGEMFGTSEEGAVKFLFLDSSANVISDAQLQWLKSELRTDKRIVLFVHHPVLPIDTPLDGSGAVLKGRDSLKAALQTSRRDITIFCGHYHMIDTQNGDRIRQYVTPAVSYQITKAAEAIEIDSSTFGYRLIVIDDDDVASDVVMLT
jgi:Icc protein